jgi:hypothetical protein
VKPWQNVGVFIMITRTRTRILLTSQKVAVLISVKECNKAIFRLTSEGLDEIWKSMSVIKRLANSTSAINILIPKLLFQYYLRSFSIFHVKSTILKVSFLQRLRFLLNYQFYYERYLSIN